MTARLRRRSPCVTRPVSRCVGRGATGQRGVTLVEWMVSLTIGMFLLAGLSLLYVQQSGFQAELEKTARQVENGRYAMQILRQDIELAGYYGEYSGALALPGAMPQPCATAVAELSSALALAVQGVDAPVNSLPCGIAAANHVDGTDILVLRRADTEPVSGALVAGQTYLQTGMRANALGFVIDQASGTALPTSFDLKRKDGVTPAAVRKFLVHVYYLSPCSVPANGSTCSASGTDDGGVSVPTLKRMELQVTGGTAQFTTAALVEGIENLQFDYGVDTSGDGSPDTFVTEPTTLGDWANVMALRVHLVARNHERSSGYEDTKRYSLGLAGTTTATRDGFRRHAFSQVVRVVNPSARRDQ